ncbi:MULTISPECIES: multicopper oxidase family protein [Corynebacterium]|uniref:multicopper oxidase family protein n=1 Tax=Corynebacterium TaxID=1716 RepID=UPI00098EC06A|nr:MULTISPECIES: multicopper oxidase family protein [Corynebacterium]
MASVVDRGEAARFAEQLSVRPLSRRGFLTVLGLAGAGTVLAACGDSGGGDSASGSTGTDTSARILFGDDEITATENARFRSGVTVEATVAAVMANLTVDGRPAMAAAYSDGTNPVTRPVGPLIRASYGDELHIRHVNTLDTDTVIHWHGIHIRNDMDGAPPLTGEAAAPGATLDYRFIVDHPGTYWYHSHSGLQADEAMIGALIVDDPDDPYRAAADHVIILDDWVCGDGTMPADLLGALNPSLAGHAASGSAHAHHGTTGAGTTGAGSTGSGAAGATAPSEVTVPEAAKKLVAAPHAESTELGGMVQHIAYPVHLINGLPTSEAESLEGAPGKTRLRIINAAGETPYRFAVGGRRMTVVETDGYPARQVEADCLIIGMAQRIDVLVDLDDGDAVPFVAVPEGSGRPAGAGAGVAVTVKTSGAADLPQETLAGAVEATELTSKPLQDRDLAAAESVVLPVKTPDRSYSLELIQSTDAYVWGIAGQDVGKVTMKTGERVRIEMVNNTDMWHPMHLHGHTFAVPDYGGLRRDTVIVSPGETVAFEFDADNPGGWMFHCHNAYHLDAGMTTNFYYER